jgi:hypothetical protein
MSPIKGMIGGNLQSTVPGTGFAPLMPGAIGRHDDAGAGPRRDDGEQLTSRCKAAGVL